MQFVSYMLRYQGIFGGTVYPALSGSNVGTDAKRMGRIGINFKTIDAPPRFILY